MNRLYSPHILVMSGLITGLAQHPIHLGWLAWFSLVPLIFVLNRICQWKDFMIAGFIWGLSYYLTVIFWLATNIGTTPAFAIISMLVAVLYCALNSAVICLILCFIKLHYTKRWFLILPFVWTALEYIRSMDILTGGPWTALANTQLDYLTIVQNVEITGIYGISFWILMNNVLIFQWINRPYPKHSFAAISFFILPWLTGLYLTPVNQVNSEQAIDVAVVQPNIHQSEKWKPGGTSSNISSLIHLSEPSISQGVDVVIWPESATSSYIIQDNLHYLRKIQSQLDDSKLITGIPYYTGNNPNRLYYNSTILISSDSISNPYHKLVLVPMGEYIPLSDYFPSLKKFNIGQSNFTFGDKYTQFEINNIKFATMICFESTLPSLSREFVNQGAEVLVFVVNDGWYENPPGPHQHAKQAIYRAVENRRPVIRCSNTGISMIINPIGNITQEIPLNEQGILHAAIYPVNTSTFYTKHGDLFAQLNVFLFLIFIVGMLLKKI